MQKYDSTAAELRAALIASTLPDSGRSAVPPPIYILHYALGVVYERAGNPDSAREAFQQALAGNLGLYMAHVRLAGLLFARGDTAASLAEVAFAADIAPREPWLVAYYGYALLHAGRPAHAIVRLRAAVALDPYYSTPYFLLGVAHDALGQRSEALAYFDAFLGRAAARDERRRWTERRAAALRADRTDATGPRE
jgi:tetratricopeptide (TPR) repeat protein